MDIIGLSSTGIEGIRNRSIVGLLAIRIVDLWATVTIRSLG